MTAFSISRNERHERFAEFLKALGLASAVRKTADRIEVELPAGFHLLRMEVDRAVSFTDREWRNLVKEIKKSVRGARVIADNAHLRLEPHRTHVIVLRVTPIERGLIKRAAEIEHRSISDFVREAALEKADSVLVVSERQKREEKPKREVEFG
jgi:uncharacterized protein (DUF1778 family)